MKSRLLVRTKTSSVKHEELTKIDTKPSIDPMKSRDFFQVHKLFTIEDLFRARVHLGHTTTATSAEMKPFIYGNRFNTAVIDLDETALLLRQALNFLAHIAYQQGIVLFAVRQPQLVHLVERTAIECGEYAHCRSGNQQFSQLTIGNSDSTFENPMSWFSCIPKMALNTEIIWQLWMLLN